MKFIPVMTEKSMKLAKHQSYTFWVPMSLTKLDIKKHISEIFGVTVTSVRTLNSKARVARNMRGKMQTIKPNKKAIVTLKDGEKIELFEEEKKVKKTKKKVNKKDGK